MVAVKWKVSAKVETMAVVLFSPVAAAISGTTKNTKIKTLHGQPVRVLPCSFPAPCGEVFLFKIVSLTCSGRAGPSRNSRRSNCWNLVIATH